MKRRKKRAGPITVPIASMGDIAFLLIIFFMICSNFVREKNIEYTSPKAMDLSAVEESRISVAMDKEGELYLDGKPIADADALKSALEPRLKDKDAMDVKGRSVMFKCDNALLKTDFEPVLEAIVGAGGIVVAVGDKKKSNP